MEALDYDFIKSCSPKVWADFTNFYTKEFSSISFLKNIPIENIPFEMQLGIFLKYFNNNGVDLDVCNTEYSMLPEHITEAFKNYENVISHYS